MYNLNNISVCGSVGVYLCVSAFLLKKKAYASTMGRSFPRNLIANLSYFFK